MVLVCIVNIILDVTGNIIPRKLEVNLEISETLELQYLHS